MSNINRIDLLKTDLEKQKNNDVFSAKLTSNISALNSSTNALFSKLDRVNKRITSLENTTRYLNDKAVNVGYSNDSVILVHNDRRKVNVIEGVSQEDSIYLKSTSNDAILYITNYEAPSVTIEGQVVNLTKNKVNKINCIYVLGQWLINVDSTYDNSLLEGCVLNYTAKALPIVESEDVGGALGDGFTKIPDVSGLQNHYEGTVYTDNTKYYYGIATRKEKEMFYSVQCMLFYTASADITTKYRALNGADFTNGVSIFLRVTESYSTSTARKHFCLGDHTNTTSLNNTITMSSTTDGVFTIKVQGSSDTDVVTGTFTSTLKCIPCIAITYDATTRTANIYKDGVVIGTGTLTSFTTGTDLVMANHFNGTTNCNFSPTEFKIYNRVLTDNELNILKTNAEL